MPCGKTKRLGNNPVDIYDRKDPTKEFLLDIGGYALRCRYDKNAQKLEIRSNKPLPYAGLQRELEFVNAMALDTGRPLELLDENNPLKSKTGMALAFTQPVLARLYCIMLGQIAINHCLDPHKITTSLEHNPPLVILEDDIYQKLKNVELIPGNSKDKHLPRQR